MYIKHMMTKSPEYAAWCSMRFRCTNPRTRMYHCYGGRGIKVCNEWLHSFDAFFFEVGPRPSPLHSLDRIRTEGNYEPGNVRWATKKEQQQNLRRNVNLTHDGMTLCVCEWSRRTGIPKSTIQNRISWGWPVEKILTTPAAKSLEPTGVSFHKQSGKWRAYVRVRHKQQYLGLFTSYADAIEAAKRGRDRIPYGPRCGPRSTTEKP